MDEQTFISEESEGIPILQGLFPDITGPRCVELGVAEEKANCEREKNESRN